MKTGSKEKTLMNPVLLKYYAKKFLKNGLFNKKSDEFLDDKAKNIIISKR
jgi:hypothetical protein